MNTKEKPLQYSNIQTYREEYIRKIEKQDNKTLYIKNHADSLYSLDLTMYSKNFTFDSLIYCSFAMSQLDDNIALHPEQRKVLDLIDKNKGLVFSAPTSFGKTFIVFEYICRAKPQNVVMIVPTLALIDEYKQKIIKVYREAFKEYNVYLSIDLDRQYDFKRNNIFILTHDRVVDDNVTKVFPQIDFLIIDEVYKLQKDEKNDRILILNIAYYNMVKISRKYVLLAPFISGIDNLDKLDDTPYFYSTDFSPVVNDVIVHDVLNEGDRLNCIDELLKAIPMNDPTLIYFPTVLEIEKYIENTVIEYEEVDFRHNQLLFEFMEWGKQEVHPEWSVIKALEKGFLVHHGQLPLGIRMIELGLFNAYSSNYTRLICTSTLLEGVNTSAKNIIITKPSRVPGKNFDAFDFYNLVGRTGRLYRHYLGTAHYLKGPKDPIYNHNQALKTIEFELTDDSIDIDINFGEYQKHDDFIEFLDDLGITYEDYKINIARKFRFRTVIHLYRRYSLLKSKLLNVLYEMNVNKEKGKLELIRVLIEIMEVYKPYDFKLNTFIINKLTYKRRQSVRKIVDATMKSYPQERIGKIINVTIRLKNSFIEFDFYKKVELIRYFMKCEDVDPVLIDVLYNKLIKNIELIYYMNQPHKKMLKDMGIYDGDVDQIIKIIGDKFSSVSELQELLTRHQNKFKSLGIVSKFIIERLIISE